MRYATSYIHVVVGNCSMRYVTSYIHVVVGNCSCIAQDAYLWCPATYMAQASLWTATGLTFSMQAYA